MSDQAKPSNQYLSADHAQSTEIGMEWDQDNQQWWDWYMSLAENDRGEGQETLIELPEPRSFPDPDPAMLSDELSRPFQLTPDQIRSFQETGYIKLKNVLSPECLSLLRKNMTDIFEQEKEQLGSQFGSPRNDVGR